MKKFFFILPLILVCLPSFAQKRFKTKDVYGVVGTYPLYDNITAEAARIKALENAKSEALIQAGVPISVWSFSGLVTSGSTQQYDEGFSDFSVQFINGLVSLLKTPVYKDSVSFGQRIVVAIIDARVNVDESQREDKSYKITVDKLGTVYRDGEVFTFDVSLYGSDSYLTIFWFDTHGGEMIYPRLEDGYRSDVFLKGLSYSFPPSNLEYTAYKTDKRKDRETIQLIIVATKKLYPYTGDPNKTSFNSIYNWLCEIPLSERCVFQEMIDIR